MFKETLERGEGEAQMQKSELETKLEQLTLMRRKRVELERQLGIPVPINEAGKIEKEYNDVAELIAEIEKDVNTIKEAEQKRLTKKYETQPQTANDEDPFDIALSGTTDLYDADRLDAAKNRKRA